MSIGIAPMKNFFIENNYGKIVRHIEDVGQNGEITTISATNRTLFLDKGYKLYCKEVTNRQGVIEYFYFDLQSPSKEMILKIHSESHDQKECQTVTEPYHIHLGKDRLPNTFLRSLDDVLKYLEVTLPILP